MSIVKFNEMENPEGVENKNEKILGIRLAQENYEDLEILFDQPLSEASEFIKKLSKNIFRTDFGERFKPVQKIGRGGFASVYSIKRISDSKIFAAKGFAKSALSQDKQK